MSRIVALLERFVLAMTLVLSVASAHADMREPLNTSLVPSSQLPKNLHQVFVDQKLGNQVPLDLQFHDELGRPVRLSDVIRDKPILLTLAYFKCPGLCTLVLNGVVESIRDIPQKLGKNFEVLTVSINPKEGPPLARAKKRSYLARYGISTTTDDEPNWRMFTGDKGAIQKLADSVGYHFLYDAEHDEYSHPSVVMILTPEGKVSQYLFGIRYSSVDLAQALKRAASTGIGSKVNPVLLYCFHYDPLSGTWTPRIMNIVRLFGVLTILTITGFLAHGFWKERAA